MGGAILLYDSDAKRGLSVKKELEGIAGSEVRLVSRPKPFSNETYWGQAIQESDADFYVINFLGKDAANVLDDTILAEMEKGKDKMPNVILLGNPNMFGDYIQEYGLGFVKSPNGYFNGPKEVQELKECMFNCD